MITRLELNNFKAWRRLRLRFATITGVFGANSAGKSSLIQFLLMLKQTREATDRRVVLDFGGPGSLANLGSYSDVVHGRDTGRDIGWKLAWALPEPLKIASRSADGRDVEFVGEDIEASAAVGMSKYRPSSALFARGLGYEFAQSSFSLVPTEGTLSHELGFFSRSHDFAFKRAQGKPPRIPPPVKTHLFPQQAKWSYQNADFLNDLEVAYENLMDRVYYLGPLREPPQRQYYWNGAMPEGVGSRGEGAIHAILAATADGETRRLERGGPRHPFQEIVAHWLKELGLIDEFSVEDIGSASNVYQPRVTASGSELPTALTDVGFGVSQVLPLLVLMYHVPQGSIILLEQPELHLHPAVQSRLADLLLCAAKQRRLQVVVASHSQSLLQRLQRRVAEGEVRVPGEDAAPSFDVSSNDVRLYFASAAGGEAHLEDLKLNQWGQIENWPDGFFGDEMGEVVAISKAALRRKMAAAE